VRSPPGRAAHPIAEHTAEAAVAAGAQGKFWEMHDSLLENQDALEDGDLLEYAAAIGLDLTRFSHEMIVASLCGADP
jgi:protein-disulfide isomerase